MSEELTLLPCPLCQATAHVEYHNGYLRVICEGEPGCPFRMGGKRFVFTDECYDWWNNLPRALTWTTEPPKVPGLYWTRKMKGDPPIIFTIYERNTPKGRVRIEARIFFSSVTSRTYRGEKPEHLGLEWAGPIPEPREPK
uniref:Restriction alleviation protein n=1 Tax=Siphoviridae sp. ctwHj1 TaxID=2825727 RepID=A0A8S5U628_9CAUD|nr:MAG TPA: restriction alleviation protein [Siphoviridae sp. ctwHj1]